MKKLMTLGKTTDNGVHKQWTMESSIVDTMNRYFRDDKEKMGDVALSIMESLRRYFEEPPPKKIA